MKILLFVWASLVAFVIGLGPAVFRSDGPPMAFSVTQAGYTVSRPVPALLAGDPVGSGKPSAGKAAPAQAGSLAAPGLEGPAATSILPATMQSTQTWEERWAVAVVLIGGALAVLAFELVRRLERGYLDSA